MNRVLSFGVVLLAFATLIAEPAQASVFVGSSGSLSAMAEFDIVQGNLQITLTNTSTADVLVPTDVLTALFWDPNADLTPLSAVLAVGSTVWFGLDGGGNVGGEWAYASGLSGAPGSAGLGVSSTGLGLFHDGNFNGGDLQGPPNGALDGLQYGITSAGDVKTTGNKPVTGEQALIKNSVIFTLAAPNGYDLSKITNVHFQYGTCLGETSLDASSNIPEPTTLIIWSLLGAEAGWG